MQSSKKNECGNFGQRHSGTKSFQALEKQLFTKKLVIFEISQYQKYRFMYHEMRLEGKKSQS